MQKRNSKIILNNVPLILNASNEERGLGSAILVAVLYADFCLS